MNTPYISNLVFIKKQKKNIEFSAIFNISFVEILVKLNKASNISNLILKLKIKLRCLFLAPNQPKMQVWFQILVKFSSIYLKLSNDGCP